MSEKWSEQDVLKMVCNPIYAGVHPYPQIVPDEAWIKAASRAMKDMGREAFLRTMLSELRSAMETARDAGAGG